MMMTKVCRVVCNKKLWWNFFGMGRSGTLCILYRFNAVACRVNCVRGGSSKRRDLRDLGTLWSMEESGDKTHFRFRSWIISRCVW